MLRTCTFTFEEKQFITDLAPAKHTLPCLTMVHAARIMFCAQGTDIAIISRLAQNTAISSAAHYQKQFIN
jgi:hypothetical protein